MSVIECSWQIPYSISGKKIELLSTQSLLRIWTYWVLNDSIEKMQLLSTQFQLRIWTYWVLNLEYSISTTFLWAIEYSITPILSEHYHMTSRAVLLPHLCNHAEYDEKFYLWFHQNNKYNYNAFHLCKQVL